MWKHGLVGKGLSGGRAARRKVVGIGPGVQRDASRYQGGARARRPMLVQRRLQVGPGSESGVAGCRAFSRGRTGVGAVDISAGCRISLLAWGYGCAGDCMCGCLARLWR